MQHAFGLDIINRKPEVKHTQLMKVVAPFTITVGVHTCAHVFSTSK